MYRVQNLLVFNNKLVGLRLYRQRDNQYYDLDISVLGKVQPNQTYLKSIKALELIEKDGQLMTQQEARAISNGYGSLIEGVPEDRTHKALVKELFLKPHTYEQCEKAVKLALTKIAQFQNLGVKVKRTYVNGKEDFIPKTDETIYYRLGVELTTNHPFTWNEDHDYCERQYDAYGVIDNDKTFSDWQDYARWVAEDIGKQYGLYIEVELEAVKYEITLDISAFSVCLTDQIPSRLIN